jgi:hypothetical protein
MKQGFLRWTLFDRRYVLLLEESATTGLRRPNQVPWLVIVTLVPGKAALESRLSTLACLAEHAGTCGAQYRLGKVRSAGFPWEAA